MREILAVEKSSHLKCFLFLVVVVFYVRENVCYKKYSLEARQCARIIRPTSGQRFQADPDVMQIGSGMFTGALLESSIFLPLAEFTFFPFTRITQHLMPCLPVF